MFYLQIPDVNVPIFEVEDSALSRLGHFATYAKLSDKQKYFKYLRNSTLLDYAGFLCLRYEIYLHLYTFILLIHYNIKDNHTRLVLLNANFLCLG